MSKTAVIVMTALVPTIGHKFLIDFARSFLDDRDTLYVIVNGRSHEPISAQDRCNYLNHDFIGNTVFIADEDDTAPQNPEDHPDFWNWWKNKILDLTEEEIDYVFASEPYGKNLADVLDARFIPVDINRSLLNVKGSDVRSNILANWTQTVDAFQMSQQTSFCFFGAESVGKTTMTEGIRSLIPEISYKNDEYARPYLETVGTEITELAMEEITKGQFALMNNTPWDRPIVLRDTDLLSTVGYYSIFGKEVPDDLLRKFHQTKSSHYFLLKTDDIPFEKDPLRYGGDIRQSEDQFWIDLLEELECEYTIIDGKNLNERVHQVFNKMNNIIEEKFFNLYNFERD